MCPRLQGAHESFSSILCTRTAQGHMQTQTMESSSRTLSVAPGGWQFLWRE